MLLVSGKYMQAKKISGFPLFVVVATGVVFYVALIFHFLPNFIFQIPAKTNPAAFIENAAVIPKDEQISFGLPVNLKIPIINVDAAVENVGLAVGGAMDVPKNRDNVGWLRFGRRPGENGTAVMAGHYGIENGKGSVLDDLYKLRKGDRVYVEDDKGMLISFVVRESKRYDPKADSSEVFGSNDGKAHLNLITCEGDWNKTLGGYPKRLVVFTDKE
jgi:LPXTG-site transpeptidase (sortase) family protein